MRRPKRALVVQLADVLPEHDFETRVEGMLTDNGWRFYHEPDSRKVARIANGPRGFPDLVALRGGRIVVAELKTARGRVSDTQRAWLAAWRRVGAETYIWRPADLPAIRRVLAADTPPDGAA